MKKIYFLITAMLMSSVLINAQTSTEVFETESNASTSFSDNGVIFNILSQVGGFAIQGSFPNTGWNGTAIDNRYIDNNGLANVTTGASFSIKTTSNLFKVNRFWVFLSANNLNQTVAGTLTITGKLSGVTKFTQTKTTGFATGLGSTNGFTLIDLTNLNGQNYSNIIIDQLQVTAGGAFNYFCLDAFTWVKDSGIVLAVDNVDSGKNNFQIYPNPTSDFINFKNAESIEKVEIYDLSGKLSISTANATKINVSKLEKGTYTVKVKTKKGIENSKFIKN